MSFSLHRQLVRKAKAGAGILLAINKRIAMDHVAKRVAALFRTAAPLTSMVVWNVCREPGRGFHTTAPNDPGQMAAAATSKANGPVCRARGRVVTERPAASRYRDMAIRVDAPTSETA
jgi:hypothetical protein